MNKRTVCYLRVSTLKQTTDSQRHDLEKFFKSKNISPEWVEDHCTGKHTKREQYQKLLGDIKGGWVEAVYCYDVSRIGRNVFDNLEFAKACLERKTRLYGVKDNTDLDTKDGRLKFNLLSSIAEYQREDIVERTKAGIAARKAKGLLQGGTAKGWTFRRVQGLLPKMYELLDAGFSIYHVCRLTGLNYRTVRKYRDSRGQPTKTRRQLNKEVYGKSDAVV